MRPPISRRAAAIVVTLAIFLTTYGMIFGYVSMYKKATPVAANGTIELAEWSFEEDGIVPLSGEWEFYPGRLMMREDFLSPSAPSATMIQVPGSWSSRMKTIGMATYRLRLHIGDAGAMMFGVKTGSIQISNRLIVNGEIVGASGNPAEKREYDALNKPYVGYFALKPGWNELLVQVANYEHSAGSGINDDIYLGTPKQISALRDRATMHDWVMVTAFLIMGLYFIGLYAQRKHDRSLIVFGLMCLCIALFTSARGERVLFDAVGDMPFWLFFRLQMVAALAAGFGFCLYVYTAFRSFCSKRLIRGT